MKKIYRTNFEIIYRYLEDACRILLAEGYKYKSGDNGKVDKIYKALTVLAQMKKIEPSENIPKSDHFQTGKGWTDFAYSELVEFNARGYEYICSTTEALIKTNAIKRMFDQFSEPIFFRGEHVFGWELISRLGRQVKIDWEKEDLHKVTSVEKDLMSDFQERVKSNTELKRMIFGENQILNTNNAGWWSIMQHYDEKHGTRMIDVSSSLFCGLYFACKDWNGNIDNTVDGKLYMFPMPLGRGETTTPYRIKGQLIDHDDEFVDTINEYYNIEQHIDTPRFRRSPVRNDRALSQDGLFVWQAQFDKPLWTFQHFPFRVHRDFKESISNELESMGYTKDRILFENRYNLSINEIHENWFNKTE